MDEPTDGLDPNQKHAVRELINSMAKHKAIIISTHILEEVNAICTRAVIIDRGKIVADGTPLDLAVKSRYHNAVNLVVSTSMADTVRPKLKELTDVARIEEKTEDDEVIFTLVPKDHKRILDQVSTMVAALSWDVRGLYVDAGRLDDVFRNLTTTDASGEAAAGAAQ